MDRSPVKHYNQSIGTWDIPNGSQPYWEQNQSLVGTPRQVGGGINSNGIGMRPPPGELNNLGADFKGRYTSNQRDGAVPQTTASRIPQTAAPPPAPPPPPPAAPAPTPTAPDHTSYLSRDQMREARSHGGQRASAPARFIMKTPEAASPERQSQQHESLYVANEASKELDDEKQLRSPQYMLRSRENPRTGAKELRRRAGSPAYEAAHTVRSGEWNREAHLSQREHNDRIYRERQQEKMEEELRNRVRQGAWDDSTAEKFRDRTGKIVPLRPMSGLLPIDSGTADPVMRRILTKKQGSSFIPQTNDWSVVGRAQDERDLMKIFRSFDANYDGQLQHREFITGLRYLGVHDVRSLIARLDPQNSGKISYSDAIGALEVTPPTAADYKSGRIQATVVPYGSIARPSNRKNADGELGKTGYASLPWATAGMQQRTQPTMSPLVKSQISRAQNVEGAISYEDSDAWESLKMLQDKLRDGKRGSATRLKAALRQADVDRDGCLGYEDFVRTLKTSLGVVLSRDEMNELTKHFDAAGTGQIDYYALVDVLSKTDSATSAATEKEWRAREATLCKVRDAMRGRSHKAKEYLSRFDERGNGKVDMNTIGRCLLEFGAPMSHDDMAELRKWWRNVEGNGESVTYNNFLEYVDRPVRAHQSSLGLGLTPQTDADFEEHKFRNRQTVYQDKGKKSGYDYLQSGFLSKDQKRHKGIMQKLVRDIRGNDDNFHRQVDSLHKDLLMFDKTGDGHITDSDFRDFLMKETNNNITAGEIDFLIEKLGGSHVGFVRIQDFDNLLKHEFNEFKVRPHLASQIGVYSGSWNIGFQNKEAMKQHGRRVYHDHHAMKDCPRSTLLDHYDHQGKTNDGRQYLEEHQSTWVPKTHLEVKMLRKMWDVIASHRYALLEALEKCDLDRSGSVTARQFVYSLETVCGHEFRSSEMDWVREKLREIKSGNVNYNEFFDALNDHGSFTHSESDQSVEGFKLTSPGGNSWSGMRDRQAMVKLGAVSPQITKNNDGASKAPKEPVRLDPWGRPLVIDGLAQPMRTADQRRFERDGNYGGHTAKVIYETETHADARVIPGSNSEAAVDASTHHETREAPPSRHRSSTRLW
jgi:Ca2+-binding EF-hand superfamily protein